jgi:hypothetical protein
MKAIIPKDKIETELDMLFRYFTDDETTVQLPDTLITRANRIRYIMMLHFDNELGQVWTIPTVHDIHKRVVAEFGEVSFATVRKDLEYLKRLHPSLDKLDVEFERKLLLRSIKYNINKAMEKGNLKVVASEHKNWAEVARVTKDAVVGGDNVMNINIINFNPSQIGATEVANIDAIVAKYLAKDRQEERDIIDIPVEVVSNE